LYYSNKEILSKTIDLSKLPITAERKIFNSSAERYGHVIIQLSLEIDEAITRFSGPNFSYSWEVNEDEDVASKEKIASRLYIPIPKDFDSEIFNEIKAFVSVFRLINQDNINLRFTLLGGSYRISERPYFSRATAEALIEIFKKLHGS
jgi:hypothetical protein